MEDSPPLLSFEYSCIIIALLQIAKLFSYTWTMGIFLCKAVHYMQSVSAICSVVTLTAMSIERWDYLYYCCHVDRLCVTVIMIICKSGQSSIDSTVKGFTRVNEDSACYSLCKVSCHNKVRINWLDWYRFEFIYIEHWSEIACIIAYGKTV